ncbi:hypothetical protein [Halorubrum ezzemoulense]|uniref:hypothetical protein n=1 Tax=Halorubrum ezzemoulense TaxID=337243 RepID=UPI00232BCEFC|nr:hypothetical protein [Halorubrum ezzemoulense]MDB9233854.1 hypothetical protein [Halorubrum ezzemoulense]
MSTNATTGDKPNDGSIDDDSTAATARHPLGTEIAEHAPYARNDARNSGDSR